MKKNVMVLGLLIVLLIVSTGSIFADQGYTSAQLKAEAERAITTITIAQAKQNLDSGGFIFLDVREPNEVRSGKIPGAVTIPRGLLEFKAGGEIADKNAKIVVYCKSGGRSALSTYTMLVKLGYVNAVNMAGGWNAWMDANYPVE